MNENAHKSNKPTNYNIGLILLKKFVSALVVLKICDKNIFNNLIFFFKKRSLEY